MAWDGWYEFDGNEIINATRTEQYARNLNVTWFRPLFKNTDLPAMLGDGVAYTTPLQDDAPWVDPAADESHEFLGLYPLAVDGVESSSRSATVIEKIGNGGAVRGVRHGTKTMVFSGVLVATSEDGAEYGLRWLKQILNGNPCEGGDCTGATMCYLSASPATGVAFGSPVYGEGAYGSGVYGGDLMTAAQCLVSYQRYLHDVTVTQGPVVTAKRNTSDGGAVWTVTFTAVAGIPYEFGPEVPIVEGFMNLAVDPWAPGIVPGAYTPFPYVATEAECGTQVYAPLYDPLCPALTPPPRPSSVALGCFAQPSSWNRRFITIPESSVPLWGDVVPTIQIHTPPTAEVRSLRLRFYADPYGTNNPEVDPCAFCGDLLISYIPADSTLVLDGVQEAVYVQQQGGSRRRADSLVFKTDGTPFDWPVLSCGTQYNVTFDLPQTQLPPFVDLSLTARVL